MTPKQLSELLVGIAQAQAAVLTAVERTLDKSAMPAVKREAQQQLHATLMVGTSRKPVSFESGISTGPRSNT